MALPIRNELTELPQWACVAFAARCARRVLPLFARAWPAAPRRFSYAVAQAVALAERAAANAGADPDDARALALEADLAAEQSASDAEAGRTAAYSAAHAAVNAVGAVACPEEAASGAYYAATDAADALAQIVGESGDAILADLELLRAAVRRDKWTARTGVPPEFFPRLADHQPAPPPSEDDTAKLLAYCEWERIGRPSLPPVEQERMYYEALARVRAARSQAS